MSTPKRKFTKSALYYETLKIDAEYENSLI